ncbi:hypothetical protein ACJMK2_031820 [Sinanodonta woodiana]|uniref:NADP-dependent oxidoreductase domain-containing protein n=1 Tax=Sinanodonta woodiana TaxID=1069815 RepID=A0ABD3X1D7_SINWO
MYPVNDIKLQTGQRMPVVGLGTWQSKPGEVKVAINAAIEAGYKHIDCAYIYGNEAEIGEAIHHNITRGKVKREDLFIVTKLWNTFHDPALVEGACRGSLKALQLKYLDLYLIHWPMGFKEGKDPFPSDKTGKIIPSKHRFTETWKAMETLVDKGLVKAIGVSNFSIKQLQEILTMKDLKHKPIYNQVEITPYCTNEQLLQFCKGKDIAVVGYAPLGSQTRPWASPDDPVLLEDPLVIKTAEKYKKSPAQVLLRWGVQRGYAVVPKSASPERIRANIQIFDFQLSEDEMKAISSLDRGHRGFPSLESIDHPEYPFNDMESTNF